MWAWLTGGGSSATEQQDGRGERHVLQATPAKPWAETFNPIAADQIKALREDQAVAAELHGARMQVVYRTWTDIKRAKGSSLGSNITDGQFFAIAPAAERAGQDYKTLPNSMHVCFPAVRPPNFTDEVDIEKPESVSFKAKNRDGQTETVTLRSFLKRIGHFISDLPRDTDWSDDTDAGPMQAAAQFSVLPCPADRTEIGVAMFGYQCKNLHIIICPDGTLGWAPEGRGSKRIFLRNPSDRAELRAVALVPEDRAEVQAGFFKPEEPEETMEQEAERYKEVENQLLHIQIEMDLPRSHKPAALSGFIPPPGAPSESLDFFSDSDSDYSDSAPMMSAVMMSAPMACSATMSASKTQVRRSRKCVAAASAKPSRASKKSAATFRVAAAAATRGASEPPEVAVAAELVEGDASACVEADLNLARVQLGSVVGAAADDDAVPPGARRAAGVPVRLTRMGYGGHDL